MQFETMKSWTVWVVKWLACIYFVVAMIGKMPIGRDDSDPGQWGERSGVKVRIDALTGCQYLEAVNGGITPRLDMNRNQIGCRPINP